MASSGARATLRGPTPREPAEFHLSSIQGGLAQTQATEAVLDARLDLLVDHISEYEVMEHLVFIALSTSQVPLEADFMPWSHAFGDLLDQVISERADNISYVSVRWPHRVEQVEAIMRASESHLRKLKFLYFNLAMAQEGRRLRIQQSDPSEQVESQASPMAAWYRANYPLLSAYAGKHVAIDVARGATGIVASGATFQEAYENAVKAGLDPRKILFDHVAHRHR